MITKTYQLDMHAGGAPVVVHLSQYDDDFSLVFNLYSSSGTFTIESGTTAAIRGTKQDGMGYSVNASLDISNKRVTVTGDQQMTAIAGKNTFELTLTKNSKELNTANFILDVERAALDKDTLASDSVIKELVDVIDRTDEIIAAARQSDAAQAAIAALTTRSETAATSAESSASDAAASKAAAEAAYDNLDSVIAQKTAAAIEEIDEEYQAGIDAVDEAYQAHIDEINEKAQQIQRIATTADQTAAEALSVATNAENHLATLDSQMRRIEAEMQDVSIDVDDLGLYQDPDTYYVYPTYKGQQSENGIPLAGGGGGGGGGDVIAAVLTVENTTGWLSRTIASGSACAVSFLWSSIEDDMPTGDGAMRITVNDVVRATMQIQQGNVTADLSQYLSTGTNKVKVRISDTYDQGKTITFNITSVELSLSSSFDASTVYSSAISFPYTPVGSVEKTIYFVVDGQTIGTQVTSVSGRQMTYTIPAQTHGGHSLRVYFESTINGEAVRSNELYYEFIFVNPLDNTTIITSNFSDFTQPQYASIPIPYQVYNPSSLTAEAKIYANGTLISTQTVDRTEQSYTYRANDYGTLLIEIKSGNVTKALTITVTESEIDVEAETENLVLHLTSQGRENTEAHPEVWEDANNHISATLTGFNFSSDGWQKDADGITCLRVSGDARVVIPYKPFASDFRSTGKTIELEFATRNVLDYDAPILTCYADSRGLRLTPQRASLKSEQSEISTQYKEDEHIRVAFVAEKRAENRFLLTYIDGIPSGVVQYPTDDDFSQPTPVNISIGSNDCTIDIYRIRIYDNDLTRHQVLDNWIADTQNAAVMLDRYTRNNVFDAYGKIVVANLPANIPYFILNAPELPQFKGDKKTITGTYTDPMYPSKSFTFEGCQINVQGTSSAPYARKNYDMQFKGGFELASGHADQYALRPGAIPFNRFVLKADVASSEGANNVELVRLYNDACPYKTPEMTQDSRVRWGIDGFPIVVFWNDTATGTVSFLGKYNFNLPKRAPAPYGYAGDDTMESWEFQNNVSDLMRYQSDYFNMEMRTDPDTGETKEAWRFDYEARFPNDEWTDIDILQEFQTFVYSTWRQNATGDLLDESVTYGGVTYTNDTAEYRLAKFKNEFPTYAELNSFLFYYIFTELFLLVDSRAKNLFIGFNGSPVTAPGRVATRKATAQPYDMDTAIGTNNEGSLVYGYSLEDTDPGQIYTGKGSVLWENIRDSYDSEIRQMYQTLRSNGIISYNTVETRFEDHQSVWPEAVWIEDAWFKYIDPLVNPDPGKQPSSIYLPMMQGSKEQQRKWWLTNRFRYMDSKWHAGEALLTPIQLRAYSKGNVTVTPYFDIYPTVRYGSHTVSARGTHGQPTTLPCPSEIQTFDDTEIYIFSAPQIESVGDLSPLKIGLADFSGAVHLQSVKIGDSASSYENTNLYQLSFGSNVLLKTIDVRNCSGLGDTSIQGHTQQVVDISGCEIVENVYFEGTKVASVTLPNGGVLKVIHLPETITNLTILNQKNITDLTVGSYANVSTLRLENVPTLDTRTILESVPANTRVRLIGFTWEADDAEDIEGILDLLDTMRGLDEQGGNVDTAQVSGTIHTGTLTGAQIAAFNARYPYINFTADHTSAKLYFYNGETLITEQTVLDGGDGSYSGSTPTKANSSDGHYSYTFAGWSKGLDDNTVDADALQNVTGDRNVYACFTANIRTYTVTWVNNGTTIETDTNVPWGTVPHFDGSTPTKDGQTSTGWLPDPTQPITGNTTFNAQYLPVYTVTFKNDTGSTTLDTQNVVQGQTATYGGTTPTSSEDASLAFLGWATSANSHTANAVLTNVQSNMTVFAAFESAVEVAEISDSWDTIIANIDNGTYSTKYKLGNYKPLDLGTEGTINMQIVAMDADELADGSDTAPLTFIAKELLATDQNIVDGWELSTLRTSYFPNTIMPLIPVNVRSRIQSVKKYTYTVNDTEGQTIDKLWIPSAGELSNLSSREPNAIWYRGVYNSNAARTKTKSGDESASRWWTRTFSNNASTFVYYYSVGASGTFSSSYPQTKAYGVCLGFCLGLEQETITD